MSAELAKAKVGTLRPSQLIYTYGVGSVVDLPYLSVMVMGLDDWDVDRCKRIPEPRLLSAVRERLGHQVRSLMHPPVEVELPKFGYNPFEEVQAGSVPVAPFPRWLLCPYCRLLAPLESELFELKTNVYRPEQARYVHAGCSKPGRAPNAVPVRFLVACAKGHLDDFPWNWFVHSGSPCPNPRLRLYEKGATGEAADIFVKCETCNTTLPMSDAFGPRMRDSMPQCSARRPHLRDSDPEECNERSTPILLGASNAWFPETLAAIFIPSASDQLGQLIEDNWSTLMDVTSREVLDFVRKRGLLPGLAKYTDDEIWGAIEERHSAEGQPEEAGTETDLKLPEWDALSSADPRRNTPSFQLKEVAPPSGFEAYFSKTVLVERVREVRALIGFTRIDSPGDLSDQEGMLPERRVAISRGDPTWVPAAEVHGEGIFLQVSEKKLQGWLRSRGIREHNKAFGEAHKAWRAARRLSPPGAGYPGMRYVLLHTLSHALMRQLALECGYTAASVRERIYASREEEVGMAGILLYTAAPDSEGTLGGLVALGEPDVLGRHLAQALRRSRVCASDPLCAEHAPAPDGKGIHAAACHACMFASETSCERGNRYLDRAALVGTIESDDLAFFA